jgi:uncharacterized DUF497 family protein
VVVGLKFDWDERKAAANLRKHGVSFEEAASAFGDPLSLTIPDPEHSQNEERCILLGISERARLVVVAHTERSRGGPFDQREARDARREARL